MKQSAIKKIQDLHDKVIHASDHVDGYTEEECLLEDKKIKACKGELLRIVCEKCFAISQPSLKIKQMRFS